MKPLSRASDEHICPVRGPGKVVIVASRSSCDGRPIATVGDKISWGATIITGTSAVRGRRGSGGSGNGRECQIFSV